MLAPSYFDIDLCAELTDADGNKLASFGKPVRIEKGTFRDGQEKAFLFTYDGAVKDDAKICIAMYDSDNPLCAGKDLTVRFDNMNTLPNNRLQLVQTYFVSGDVNLDGTFDVLDVFDLGLMKHSLIQKSH